MKKKFLALVLALTMALSLLPVTAMAAPSGLNLTSFSELANGAADEDAAVAMALAKAFVGDSINVEKATISYANTAQIAMVNNASSLFHLERGIMLSTGDARENLDFGTTYGKPGTHRIDSDLKALVDAEEIVLQELLGGASLEYGGVGEDGGDTVSLEFTIKATGSKMQFNYVFGSCEFNQGPKFNDVFGLFVKVSDSLDSAANVDFKNIALLDGNKNVSITSLRTDTDKGYDGSPLSNPSAALIKLKHLDFGKFAGCTFNGISKTLTAELNGIEEGDYVTIKFVIADVGDTGVDSAIIMQSGSLKFSGSANELANITDGVSLALNQAVNSADDFSVTVDGSALADGLYNVVGATSTSPTITFDAAANLTCASKISVSIRDIDAPITINNKLPHDCRYAASGAVITETCSNGCGHSATATIAAPAANTLVYDGTAKAATVSYSDKWQGGTLAVTYDNNENVNVGTVNASITKADATAMVSYEITAGTTPSPDPGNDPITPPQPPVYYPPVDPTPVIPSVDVDIHDDTLSDAAKAVGSAVKSGNADITPVAGYTKESIAQMQKDDALKLVVEKKDSYDPAEKSLIDTAAQEKGKTSLVQFLEIDVTLRTMNDVIVAEVDDTIVDLTITVELNAEMQKAAKEGKTIYVARAHDGKVTFLEGTLNAEKTKFTFDSSKFSTYALVASDGETVTSAKTADPIGLYFGVTALATVGSAWLAKKKED